MDLSYLLFKNPIAFLITAIIALALLIAGITILWVLHLLTGVIIGLVLLVVVWALVKTGALPLDKYPWMTLVLIAIPVAGFGIGVAADRIGAFYLTPIMSKPAPITPYDASQTGEWIQTNPEVLLVIIVIGCIIAVLLSGLLRSGKK